MDSVSTPTVVVLIVALLSAAVPAIAPIMRGRRASPESTAVLLTGSAHYLSEIHNRLSELEARVVTLEAENRSYFNEYGPPPD